MICMQFCFVLAESQFLNILSRQRLSRIVVANKQTTGPGSVLWLTCCPTNATDGCRRCLKNAVDVGLAHSISGSFQALLVVIVLVLMTAAKKSDLGVRIPLMPLFLSNTGTSWSAWWLIGHT
jgi:hypothetical protein